MKAGYGIMSTREREMEVHEKGWRRRRKRCKTAEIRKIAGVLSFFSRDCKRLEFRKAFRRDI